MKTLRYWTRFLEKIQEEYNIKYPKIYSGEFEKENRKFRVKLIIEEEKHGKNANRKTI